MTQPEIWADDHFDCKMLAVFSSYGAAIGAGAGAGVGEADILEKPAMDKNASEDSVLIKTSQIGLSVRPSKDTIVERGRNSKITVMRREPAKVKKPRYDFNEKGTSRNQDVNTLHNFVNTMNISPKDLD